MGVNREVKIRTSKIYLDPSENLYEMRCEKCNRLLGKVSGKAQILCSRCSAINEYIPQSDDSDQPNKIRDVKQKVLAEKLSKSFSTELFSVSEDINKCLLDIWRSNKWVKVPSDLFFEGNIPLMDSAFWVDDSSVSGGCFRFRVLVFGVQFKNDDEDDIEYGEEVVVGALRIWVGNKKVNPRTIMVTLPIIVTKGFPSIVIPTGEIEARAVMACEGKGYEVATDFFKALYMSCLKTWYGMQVAILHPEIREIIRKQRICISRDLREHTEEEYKEDRRRNENRRYHHVKRIYINKDDLEKVIYEPGDKRSTTRRTRLWYVCGHWRKYKSGLETFIHPYWKGVDRNNDLKIVNERERILDMTEDARKELHGSEETLEERV